MSTRAAIPVLVLVMSACSSSGKPKGSVAIEAEDLASAYRQDPKAANRRFFGRQVVVSGSKAMGASGYPAGIGLKAGQDLLTGQELETVIELLGPAIKNEGMDPEKWATLSEVGKSFLIETFGLRMAMSTVGLRFAEGVGGDIKDGTGVTARCIGDGLVAGRPVLRECVLVTERRESEAAANAGREEETRSNARKRRRSPGSLLAKLAKQELAEIESQVAADAVKQYEIARRSGTKIDRCVHAQMVAAAFIQAKDEANYKKWKAVEAADCAAAGVPR